MEGTRELVLSAAEQVRRAGTKTRVLVGTEASEESLSLMTAPRIAMFATHGYFMPAMPSIHLKIRSDASHSEINQDFFETANPLHRSMLILAGANRRNHQIVRYAANQRLLTETQAAELGMTGKGLDVSRREIGDGLLTAYEVLNMQFDDTELVILAGCPSGLGGTSEDKYPGFRQAEG
jgi:hypothetical protein